ncbi:MAG: glutamate racemase [Firmicutes bacterium]|nr:glutamate racemase [Bacillota bacterium]
MDNRPIGIFDSGLGGLTAVNALKSLLPTENFVYVGDTARVPYGGKDVDTLRLYSDQIITFLQNEHNVKLIIVACGTISTNVMDYLQAKFSVPIIDVVQPGIAACLQFCERNNKHKVGVIATTATVKSGFFQRALEKNLDLQILACPLFVPIIEAGLANTIISAKIAEEYLYNWAKSAENPDLYNLIDVLIFGCTHYPLLNEQIQRILPNVHLIDMAQSALLATNQYLSVHKMYSEKKLPSKFYVSGDVDKFNQQASKITGLEILAEKLHL